MPKIDPTSDLFVYAMTLKEFLEHCTGDWFAQRTNYGIDSPGEANSKATLAVTDLAVDHAVIAEAKKQFPEMSVLAAWEIAFDNSSDWAKKSLEQGSALMVFCGDSEPDTAEGKVFQRLANGSTATGHFWWEDTGALNVQLFAGELEMNEKIWFATSDSQNLRLRSSTTKKAGEVLRATFYSEIRRMKA
ncbi:MAG: phycobiliprotein lyase [Cyanobacteria bacterium P01_H01_bin.15]